MGDLVFGESFQCLKHSQLHPWVENIFTWCSTAAILGMIQRFWPFSHLIMWFIPDSMVQSERYHREVIQCKLQKRLKNPEPTHYDFMSAIEGSRDVPGGLKYEKIFQTCSILMVGGGETVSANLCGTIYHILQNRRVYDKMVKEIRSSFLHSSEIDMDSFTKLEYIWAVIQKGLRMTPPVPISLRRIAPSEGLMVSGCVIPGNTLVAVDHYASFLSSANFHNPSEFVPERWLDNRDKEYASDKRGVVQPFSAGPRNCIGKNLAIMELKLLIVHIFFSLDIEIAPESLSWYEDLKVYAFFQRGPFMVKVAPVTHS